MLDGFEPKVVVIEACSLAGWVRDACVEYGNRCKVANTSSELWKFKHVKRKTDRDDALRLAQLEASGQLPTVELLAKPVRQKLARIAGRQRLVGMRARNRIRSLLVGEGLGMRRGAHAWTEAGLTHLETLARLLNESGADEYWRGLLQQVLTEYRQACVGLAELEKTLDALGRVSARVPPKPLLRIGTMPAVSRDAKAWRSGARLEFVPPRSAAQSLRVAANPIFDNFNHTRLPANGDVSRCICAPIHAHSTSLSTQRA